eukprot:6826971-Ditylum_brightwellii.AAC.1
MQGCKDEATFQNKMGGSERGCKSWLGMEEDNKINYLTNIISDTTSVISPSPAYIVPAKQTMLAKADTGASRRYWTHREIQGLTQVTPLINEPM